MDKHMAQRIASRIRTAEQHNKLANTDNTTNVRIRELTYAVNDLLDVVEYLAQALGKPKYGKEEE